MIISKKKNFTLISISNPNRNIFNLIIKKIPNSIFSKLDFFFFKNIVKKNIIDLYVIKKKKKLSSIISTVTVDNYELLKKKIFVYLILNPYTVISNFIYFLTLFKKDENEIDLKNKKKFLHLLHLVIFKDKFSNFSIKEKDNIINFFFKIIIKKNNANFFYLCYEKRNLKANKYYKRNKFNIYKQNKKIIFVKKK